MRVSATHEAAEHAASAVPGCLSRGSINRVSCDGSIQWIVTKGLICPRLCLFSFARSGKCKNGRVGIFFRGGACVVRLGCLRESAALLVFWLAVRHFLHTVR